MHRPKALVTFASIAAMAAIGCEQSQPVELHGQVHLTLIHTADGLRAFWAIIARF